MKRVKTHIEINPGTTQCRAFPWLVGLLVFGVGSGPFTLNVTGQTSQNTAASNSENLKQVELFEKLFAAKQEQTRDYFEQGRRIEDIPQQEIEADLARRLSLPVETLRASIAAGLKSSNALTRSLAELLSSQRNEAIATANVGKQLDANAVQQLIAADQIIAEAHYEKAEYLPALAARERIVALIDSQAEPLAWAASQQEVAGILRKLARHADAVTILEQIIPIKKAQLGPENLSYAASLSLLALLWQDQGKLAKAEPLCRQVLEINEAKLGKDHLSVATDLNNLANLLKAQGKQAEAEPLYRRAIEIGEKKLGMDHPNVAISLNNLAELYRIQGKLTEAKPLYFRALEIGEAKLGKDHPDVATWLNNLALLLQAQNKLTEAEPLYQRAIEIGETKLGKDHPAVATRLNNLAGLLKAQNRMAEAEVLYRRALEIGEAKLGRDHPKVAIQLNNLALLLESQGKLKEVEPLYRRMLGIIFLHRKRNGTPFEHEQQAVKNYSTLLEKMKRTPEQISAEIETIKRDAGLEE